MGLKKRLAVAFAIMLIVPTVMFTLISAIIYTLNYSGAERGKVDVGDDRIMYYAIRNVSQQGGPQVEVPMIQALIIIILIILLTAVIMVTWLYRSLIKPLNVLRMATANMKEGNLNFSISGDPEDELGLLCEEFEEMRIRLKEQIDSRLQYEQDTVELISNISHDLKTPLTAIKGYAEGILDGVADTDEKKQKYIRTIYTKASDMTVLVDELSLYSKIDSNIVPYNIKKLDVNAYFGDCVDEQSLDMEVKGIELKYINTVPEGTFMKADPEQLRRVINNITTNAVKYMGKPEGKIEIRVSVENCYVCVEIEDNGIGIAEEDLQHVFERFFRADSSRGTKKGGSGLGLAIAKKIIEDNGGTIEAKSKLGVGSCFSFTIPLYSDNNKLCGEVEDAEYSEISETRRIGFLIGEKGRDRNE